MRVLVQNVRSSEYWRGPNRWTKEERAALDFQKTVKAIEFCVRERLFDAQIILRFGDSRDLDITLPLRTTTPQLLGDSTQRLIAE